MNKSNKTKIATLLAVCFFALAAMTAFCIVLLFNNIKDNSRTFVIEPNSTYEEVVDGLVSNSIIKSEKSFRIASRLIGYSKPKTGRYKLSDCESNLDLLMILRRGQHFPVRFTFNNIRTKEQFVKKVGDKFFFEPEELSALLQDNQYLEKYGLNDTNIVSMFIPNTYEFYYDITAEVFLDKFYGYYTDFWTEDRIRLAKEAGLSKVEVSTLASIVEEENSRAAEKAIIAGLYINRLRKGMLLQSDPTVKFALGDFTRQRILNADLQVDSPYNTYRYKGLPPGPIRIPEASTVDSVLHYRHHNFIFMCAKEDFSGYHNFTDSPAVHMQNAARYRKALNERNITR